MTPDDFDSLAAVARRLNEFESLENEIAEPFFGWKFTRDDMDAWLERLAERDAGQFTTAA